MRIGVLALQGAFAEHVTTLRAIGVEAVEVRLPKDLEDIDGLILPGGESTAMRRLIDRWGMRQPILDLAASGAPLFGTCAGMIVLAKEIAGGEEPILPLLDVTVERNAFGRQLDSFETELVVSHCSATRPCTRCSSAPLSSSAWDPGWMCWPSSRTGASSPSGSAT